MAVDLHYILSGIGMRRSHIGDQHLIDNLISCRVDDIPKDEAVVFKERGNTFSATAKASGPLRRTIPIPPSPRGVERATIVSLYIAW